MNIESLLKWSEPKEVTTRRGPATVRSAQPDGAFWNLWRDEQAKAELRAAGVSVDKPESGWRVSWWQNPGAATADQSDAPAQTVTVAKPAPKPLTTSKAHGFKLSAEQEAIQAYYETGAKAGNAVVRARAGTGKTFGIVLGIAAAPEEAKCYVVFNKRNQREALEKISDPKTDVVTLNALGFRFVRMYWPSAKPDNDMEQDRLQAVHRDIPDEVGQAVLKLVGFAKNMFVGLPTVAQLSVLADDKMIDAAAFEEEEAGGWLVAKLAATALKVMEMSMIKDKEGRISFNDQVWLPLAMKWVRPVFDFVVVDEAQDMNVPQLTMARLACKQGGRLCVTGDDRQAIYGFRGAASDGLDMMKRELHAKEFGLTITRRCPKLVVAMACELVPDYRAADDAPEGIVEHCDENAMLAQLAIGDAVLSRVNAPLMKLCLALLKAGTPARIEGRDIGRALLALVRKMKGRSVPHFIEKVEAWAKKQKARAGKGQHAESKCELINDQKDTLVAVAEGAASVAEIERRIQELFQDSDANPRPAVVFSSVHKAKGLEWDRVFLLRKTFMRRPKPGKAQGAGEKREEENIYYVALTRAKRHLVLVSDAAPVASVPATATGTEQAAK